MKVFFLMLTTISLASCGSTTSPNNTKIEAQVGRGANIEDLGEYNGGHIYKVLIDGNEYIMVNDIKGVAIVKHR